MGKLTKHNPTEWKTFKASIVDVDEAQGIVEAIVNTYGIIDYGNDIIYPGFFTKSITERGRSVRVLDSHNTHSILNILGRPLEIRELRRDELPAAILAEFPHAQGGLYTKTQYEIGTETDMRYFNRIKNHMADEYSIGFDDLQSFSARVKAVDMGGYEVYQPYHGEDLVFGERVVTDDSGREIIARHLKQGRLWEYSCVVFGMNQGTGTISAKGLQPDEGKPYSVFEENGEYCVYKIDESGNRAGSALGCHSSRQDAIDQIVAIEISENEDGSKTYGIMAKDLTQINERLTGVESLLQQLIAQQAGVTELTDTDDLSTDKTTDEGPQDAEPVETPTPEGGAGPLGDDDAPDSAELIALLDQQAAELEALFTDAEPGSDQSGPEGSD